MLIITFFFLVKFIYRAKFELLSITFYVLPLLVYIDKLPKPMSIDNAKIRPLSLLIFFDKFSSIDSFKIAAENK